MGMTLSGCLMVPLAFVGPAVSGFSTASIIKTGATSGINYLVKQSSGKSLAEHALSTLSKDIYKQTYFPIDKTSLEVAP